MHIASPPHDRLPRLQPDLVPPLIRGTAALAAPAFAGAGLDALLERIDFPVRSLDEAAARAMDMVLAHELSFAGHKAALLQRRALRSAGCSASPAAGSAARACWR